MPRPTAGVCLLCSFQIPWQRGPVSISSPWQTTRSMTQLRRHRPKRMALSPTVSRTPPKPTAEGRRRTRRVQSPFAAMNQRSADLRYAPPPRSESQTKRSSRSKQMPQKERETFHALKMQQTLSRISYGRRNAVKTQIEETNSFTHFGLLPTVTESVLSDVLAGLTDVSPSPVQRLAIPALSGHRTKARRHIGTKDEQISMQQFLLAAETGSGKTLAYLLPILNAIKEAEAAEIQQAARQKSEEEAARKLAGPHAVQPPPLNSATHSDVARPRAIVLLPTSELVSQVGAVVKKLSHTVKFRSALISSAYSGSVIRNRVFAPAGIDILISTPHLLASISDSDPNILSRVKHLVIDEADSLLDRSFSPSTLKIVDKATPSLRQLILCSATIPRSLDSLLRQRFPDMQRLVTPHLHAIPRRVQLGVVDVDKIPYQGNRMLACADTIWTMCKTNAQASDNVESQDGTKRLLVFVNEREKSQEVAQYLISKGIDAVALNRDNAEQRQQDVLDEFTTRESTSAVPQPLKRPGSAPAHKGTDVVEAPSKRTLANTKVLVATDLGSRGIDTLAVKTVILYDVPHTTIDFIHRLGRTGRMGQRGRGIVLVGKHDRKDVVREVREGMYKGQALI